MKKKKIATMLGLAFGMLVIMLASPKLAMAGFNEDFVVETAPDHVIIPSDSLLQLTMDKNSGSSVASTSKYLFGYFNMKMKLISGNSAGTVTTFYLFSNEANHDEIDFEFLGNYSGDPYLLHTNIFASGVGNREQQFFLWFDPTADFHDYTIIWNPQQILFLVDGRAVRSFPNNEAIGVPYLKSQWMNVHASLWNGETWATLGGLRRIDWNSAPFVASYSEFVGDSCFDSADSPCMASKWWNQPAYQFLSTNDASSIQWVRANYLKYDYCYDTKLYPNGFPAECSNRGF